MRKAATRIVTMSVTILMVLAPGAAFAQDGGDLVGLAKAEAIRSARIANETAMAVQSGSGKADGLERAIQAVQAAEDRGSGNGRALGRGNAANVLAALAAGESPAGIGREHGKAVSAAARGLSNLAGEKGTNGNGNGWGKGGNPNKGDTGDGS